MNLVIGHPTVIYRGRLNDPRAASPVRTWLGRAIDVEAEPIGEAVVVAMPLRQDSALLMWYLTPTKEIDDVIARNGWERRRLRMP